MQCFENYQNYMKQLIEMLLSLNCPQVCYGKSEATILRLLHKSIYFIVKPPKPCVLKHTVHGKVESENVCNMQIMQKLLINKPNFPLKHTEDFHKITHVASY